jgi:hypothetical protein
LNIVSADPDALIIVASVASDRYIGANSRIEGAPMPFDPVLQLSNLNSSNSFKILGEENSSILGGAGAGDVNGAGLADIIIGAPFANGSQPGPRAGRPTSCSVKQADPEPTSTSPT